MDDVDFQALTEKLGNVILQNKQLRRANLNLKKKNKHLGRVITKMNEKLQKIGSHIIETVKREVVMGDWVNTKMIPNV